MNSVTQILAEIEAGNQSAAAELLPLVYDELRQLAENRMRHERPGNTLQATALVHDAYLRLVEANSDQGWESRGHFFSCAAEAMRRILIENARRRQSLKRGGAHTRIELHDAVLAINPDPDDLLALNEALERLAAEDEQAAEIAKLRLFAGLTAKDAALSLGIKQTTGFRHWTYARAFLHAELKS